VFLIDLSCYTTWIQISDQWKETRRELTLLITLPASLTLFLDQPLNG